MATLMLSRLPSSRQWSMSAWLGLGLGLGLVLGLVLGVGLGLGLGLGLVGVRVSLRSVRACLAHSAHVPRARRRPRLGGRVGGVLVRRRRRRRRPTILEPVAHFAHYLLRRHDVPDAVAREHDELVVGVSLEGPWVRG